MVAQLTENAVRYIYGLPEGMSDFHPILQILNVKQIAAANNGPDRYRAVMSDGQHFVQGMLATQLGDKIRSGEFGENVVVQVDKFMNNMLQGRSVCIVLEATVLENPGVRIGAPMDIRNAGNLPPVPQPPSGTNQPLYNSTNNTTGAAAAAAAQEKYGSSNNSNPYGGGSAAGGTNRSSPGNPYGNRQSSPQRHAPPIMHNAQAAGGNNITPIASLNMYNNRWTIRARVTDKSDIRSWSNSKGEGTLFSISLLDETMDIRATFFKEAVDKFYHMLQVGQVYEFMGGRLKVANMQWNTCKSNFEITFDQNSEIHLSNDDGHISQQTYDFVKIGALEAVEPNKNVDVLAIAKHVSEPATLVSKKSGQELTKCDVTLVDDSGVEINLTMWGSTAATAVSDLAGQPVVAVRRTRVSDFNDKSLSGGIVDANPDVPEKHQLAQWWQSTGGTVSTRSLSANAGGGGARDSLVERKSVASITNEGMGRGEKPDWLSFEGALTFLKKDKEDGAWYPACANSGEPCKNRFKMSNTTDGQWFCDKCQNTYPEPVRRWIFSGVVEDSTSSTWVSFFNEQAETLFGGLTADECYKTSFGDGGSGFDQDAYDSVFAKVVFSEWIFKCKVKTETYNDDQRVKTSVYSLHPVDYVKDSKEMLQELEKF